MNWALPERTIKLGSRTQALIDGHTVGVIAIHGIPRPNRSQILIGD